MMTMKTSALVMRVMAMAGPRALAPPAMGVLGLALGLARPAMAQVFSENFEVNPTGNWVINNGPSDFAANFFFNYSSVGIPQAPSGAGSRGMKLQANLTNGIFSGMSVSPIGQAFTGDYRLRFDWWANFNGPFPVGGSGSTNLSTFGIGTTGNLVQWPGGVQHSVWFAGTGDGNSAADWRAYSSAAPGGYLDGSPVYSAPTRNSSDPYYAGFGSNTAPAAQLALFPQQTGVTFVGSAGMEWHDVIIEKSGGFATWSVDGLPIASIDLSTVTLGGSNIFFGHSDTNATSSSDPNDVNLLFTLIDNIRVTGVCAADVAGRDGVVNIDDLLAVIAAWGACPVPPAPCPADIAQGGASAGVVNIDDLLAVISAWGPCP